MHRAANEKSPRHGARGFAVNATGKRSLRRWCAGRGGLRLLRLLLAVSPLLALGHDVHLHLALGEVDDHRVSRTVLEAQQFLRQRIFDDALDHPTQRAGAVDLVEPFVDDLVLGSVADAEVELLGSQVHRHLGEHQVDNVAHLRHVKAVEHHHRVDAVEELRAEGPLELLHDLVAHLAVLRR